MRNRLLAGVRARRALSLAARCVACAATLAGLALIPTSASAQPPPPGLDCSQQVSVQVSSDACGKLLAVSLTGNAYGADSCPSGPSQPVSCITISLTGNASNDATTNPNDTQCGTRPDLPLPPNPVTSGLPVLPSGIGLGCIAISGTGSATNNATGVFDTCRTSADNSGVIGCIALSGTGPATNSVGSTSCNSFIAGPAITCIALSGTGPATNQGGDSCAAGVPGLFGLASLPNVQLDCIAGSLAGSASNSSSDACASGSSLATVGCVALSGSGSASNTVGPGGCANNGPFGGGIDVGCIAASITGTPSNTVSGPCAQSTPPSGSQLASELQSIAGELPGLLSSLPANLAAAGSQAPAALQQALADLQAQNYTTAVFDLLPVVAAVDPNALSDALGLVGALESAPGALGLGCQTLGPLLP